MNGCTSIVVRSARVRNFRPCVGCCYGICSRASNGCKCFVSCCSVKQVHTENNEYSTRCRNHYGETGGCRSCESSCICGGCCGSLYALHIGRRRQLCAMRMICTGNASTDACNGR